VVDRRRDSGQDLLAVLAFAFESPAFGKPGLLDRVQFGLARCRFLLQAAQCLAVPAQRVENFASCPGNVAEIRRCACQLVRILSGGERLQGAGRCRGVVLMHQAGGESALFVEPLFDLVALAAQAIEMRVDFLLRGAEFGQFPIGIRDCRFGGLERRRGFVA
jgi:hypothetical protein